jgi:hypothetical protein
MPAATRSALTVRDPSEAAFMRYCFTMGILGNTNAYRKTHSSSKKHVMAKNSTEKINI